MAIYNNKDVEFSGIRQPILTTGGKISVGKYTIDENGNIIEKKPIINAIDIDWNNASTTGIEPIKSTEDLINLLKNIKESVPDNIQDLQGANDLLTFSDLESLKPQLTGKSAYEIAKETYENNTHQAFPYQTEAAWVESLKGEIGPRGFSGLNGTNGKSAYEALQEYYQSIGEPFPYQNENEWINSLANVATKTELNSLRDQINNLASEELVEQIDARINAIVDGASDAFDTLKEFEDWIHDMPLTPEEISNAITNINNNISNLTGELTEERAVDDGQGNITYITDYKTYDKTGEAYAKSLEEVNEKINNLLNTVSVAKDVQDGAQENVIEYITHKDQTFNIGNENVVGHLITAEKPENSKTVLLGINQSLLESINNDIINKSVNQSKTYIDSKLSWEVE